MEKELEAKKNADKSASPKEVLKEAKNRFHNELLEYEKAVKSDETNEE